jgi:hypothetical protein
MNAKQMETTVKVRTMLVSSDNERKVTIGQCVVSDERDERNFGRKILTPREFLTDCRQQIGPHAQAIVPGDRDSYSF